MLASAQGNVTEVTLLLSAGALVDLQDDVMKSCNNRSLVTIVSSFMLPFIRRGPQLSSMPVNTAALMS